MFFLSVPNVFLVCSYLWGSPLVNSSRVHTAVMYTITSLQINKGLLLLLLPLSFLAALDNLLPFMKRSY